MTLSPATAALVRAALERHAALACEALSATDLDAAKAALDACWTARMTARDLITEAEREAREGALRSIGQAA